MMTAEDVEKRTPEFLIKKYKTKQPGECNPQDNHPMKEYRQNERIAYAATVMNDKSVNLKGNLRRQVVYLIEEGPKVNFLCPRCKWETVVVAFIFYVKFTTTPIGDVERYSIAKDVGLTNKVFLKITTKLARFFQDKMALNSRIRAYDSFE